MALVETIAPTEPDSPQWVPEDNFGLRLTQIRRSLKMSQQAIAAKCGLDDGSWSNWERGSRPRNLVEIVQQISEALNVDRDWLMWGYTCPSCGETRSRCSCASGQRMGLGVDQLTLELV